MILFPSEGNLVNYHRHFGLFCNYYYTIIFVAVPLWRWCYSVILFIAFNSGIVGIVMDVYITEIDSLGLPYVYKRSVSTTMTNDERQTELEEKGIRMVTKYIDVFPPSHWFLHP